MLVVVTIIALFAALVGPKLFGNVDKAKRTAAIQQINTFMTALGNFKLDTGVFPTTEQGLQALRVKPENAPNYKFPGEHGDEPDIVSLGADGQPGGDGNNADVVSWKNN